MTNEGRSCVRDGIQLVYPEPDVDRVGPALDVGDVLAKLHGGADPKTYLLPAALAGEDVRECSGRRSMRRPCRRPAVPSAARARGLAKRACETAAVGNVCQQRVAGYARGLVRNVDRPRGTTGARWRSQHLACGRLRGISHRACCLRGAHACRAHATDRRPHLDPKCGSVVLRPQKVEFVTQLRRSGARDLTGIVERFVKIGNPNPRILQRLLWAGFRSGGALQTASELGNLDLIRILVDYARVDQARNALACVLLYRHGHARV
jgi:hypothetical protein